ncbi:MAG: hypothetical protein LQ352_001989 [Teloschistes flavicans]|nr:MAG: hypothetical protein LQ352_001989 [Teloschistes flavicans]
MVSSTSLVEREAPCLEPSTVDHAIQDSGDDSEYRLAWTKVMSEGKYRSSENYKSVEVLLLRWDDTCDDMTTKHEVKQLSDVFTEEFNWHTEIHCLKTDVEGKLQIQVNKIVINWVDKYDKSNTLLLVYYAGHGKPGKTFGQLEIHGQVSPNDHKDKQVNAIVWNNTEELLKPAEADVLEIFDCCHAGTVGLVRGTDRPFEFLGACAHKGSTKAPGSNSFTTALIWALKKLKEDMPGGRFTTRDLERKIKDAPEFPKGQEPQLLDRENYHAGRIILGPLPKEGLEVKASPTIEAMPDPRKQHCVTLCFDFAQKPSIGITEELGREFNRIFEAKASGVARVRWGGVRKSRAGQAADWFLNREARRSQSQSSVAVGSLDLPTPDSSSHNSPQPQQFLGQEQSMRPPSGSGSGSHRRVSSEELEEALQGPKKKRRLSTMEMGGE